MFDLAITINTKDGIISNRTECSNKELAVYLTIAMLHVQRDDYEQIEEKEGMSGINLFVSKDKKHLKITTVLDKSNTSDILSDLLTATIRIL